MNAQRLAATPAPSTLVRRPLRVAEAPPATARAEPPACEYADLGRGNGFLLERAGARPVLNVIGEIG